MTETNKLKENKLKNEVPTNQQQQAVENKETKLIIEGKEFEVIKYSCDANDKWYIGELGLMIEKKVMKRDDWTFKKGDIIWDGASSGKEKEQLKKLIYFGQDEVDHWKKKIKELKETYLDIRGDAGKEISDKFDDYQVSLHKAINGLEDLKKYRALVEIGNQKRIRKKCIGCYDTFTCLQAKNYDYCKNCFVNGSRYLNKNSQCSECDSSGLIKFPNQPVRNCKLCYLACQEQREDNIFAKYA